MQHKDEHGNAISDALYYIDEYFTDEGYAIYLSYLPPGKMTSEAHRHSKDMIEHYRIIRGSAEITLGFEQTQTISLSADKDNYVRIPFGMGHRMRGGFPDGSLTLITTENPHGLPPGKLHLRGDVRAAA
jgi:mannose-6-phosphate isomerase-like protein (cupin superfamily)